MEETSLTAGLDHTVSDELMATLNRAYIAERTQPISSYCSWWVSSLEEDKLITDRNLYEAEQTAVSGLMLAYAQTLVPQREANLTFVQLSLTEKGLHWSGMAFFERRTREQAIETVMPLVLEAA